MFRTFAFLTALFITAASLKAAPSRSPEVTLDTSSIGGYTGDYVLIYNPNTSPLSALSTGNMQNTILTEPAAPGSSALQMIDVDSEIKHRAAHHSPPPDHDPHASYQVGSRQSFYVDPNYTSTGQYILSFECIAEGEYCYVWSLTDGGHGSPSLQEMDAQTASALAAEFDSCFPLLRGAYGQQSNPGWFDSCKLNILCYDIYDGWVPGGSFIGGYFSADCCANSYAPLIHIDTFPTIWQGQGEPTLETARRVLVHEYTHLLTFAATGGSDDWIEEVIASSAEELCYPGSCIVPRISSFRDMNGASMYEWDLGFGMTDALYARGALFGQYLYTRFGSDVFGSIISYLGEGNSAVTAFYFATGALLADVVKEFNLAVIINDTSVLGGIYGFDTQPGYDPALWGIEDPYSLLSIPVFTGKSCTLYGGGAIIVRPKYSAYYPPSDASSGLKYVGVTINYPSYTVDFYGMEGELLDSQTVPEGSAAVAPEPPYIEGYTFVKWSAETNNVQCDTSVYALYAHNDMILYCDADCSGRVDFADVSQISLCLNGMCTPPNAFYINADVDRDGKVGLNDASALYLMLCGRG